MARHHLLIVCGVPGAGKSTLAHRAAERWGAVSFASETFADELGPAGRTSSGDLTKQAILHAYSAMGAAVTASLATSKLVLAVGSFRAGDQRRRFRDIARDIGARATTLRIASPVETAATRVQSRLASGERGPTADAIRQIDAALSGAGDIDVVLSNDTSIEHFHRRVDAMMEFLVRGSDQHPPAATVFVEQFEELAACELALARDLIEPKRRQTEQCTRNEKTVALEQERQRSRDRMTELRNCLLLGLPRPIERNIAAALQQATDKWLNAVDRLGTIA